LDYSYLEEVGENMAKNVIFYFSGTGNSLVVAKQLEKMLEDTLVVSIISSNPTKIISEDTERIGLVYPVYMNALPKPVAEFIRNYKAFSACYVFAVATHGGVPGIAGLNLYSSVLEAGIHLDSYFEVKMINNTPKGVAPKPLMRLNWENEITEDKVQHMVMTSRKDVDEIYRHVQDKKKYFETDGTKLGNKIKLALMKPLWKISAKNPPKLNFILDDTCIGCKLCEQVCTTNRIRIMDDKPVWTNDDCNYCYACFNFCPKQAIGVKHYTKKLGRYHHPDICIEDIIGQK